MTLDKILLCQSSANRIARIHHLTTNRETKVFYRSGHVADLLRSLITRVDPSSPLYNINLPSRELPTPKMYFNASTAYI